LTLGKICDEVCIGDCRASSHVEAVAPAYNKYIVASATRQGIGCFFAN
jgi:hypothetical protein